MSNNTLLKFKLKDGNVIIATQSFIDIHYPGALQVYEEPTVEQEEPEVPIVPQVVAMRQAP